MLSAILEQTINGLMAGSVYVLVALGMVLIYGVMHVLNFAHGVLLMVGAYVCHFFFTRVTSSYLLSIALCIAATASFSPSYDWAAKPCASSPYFLR